MIPLREYVEAIFNERVRALDLLHNTVQKNIEDGDQNLRDHVGDQIAQIREALISAEKLVNEKVAGVTERLTLLNETGHKSIDARITHVQREVQISHEASERAIAKTEDASNKRFESVNEWRAQSLDRERSMTEQMQKLLSTLMPRPECEQRLTGLEKEIGRVSSFMDKLEGRSGGLNSGWGYLLGGVGLLVLIFQGLTFYSSGNSQKLNEDKISKLEERIEKAYDERAAMREKMGQIKAP